MNTIEIESAAMNHRGKKAKPATSKPTTSSTGLLEKGVHETPFPFIRETVQIFKGESNGWGWRIGCEKKTDSYLTYPDPKDCTFVADGVGVQIVEIISIVSPGGMYDDRAFYKRRWRDPDGKEFAREPNPLLNDTVAAVKKLIRGFRHPYTIRAPRPQLRLVKD